MQLINTDVLAEASEVDRKAGPGALHLPSLGLVPYLTDQLHHLGHAGGTA